MDRVLVVDDETGIRGLVAQWVEGLGCAAVEAANAEQAVRTLEEAPCDPGVADILLETPGGASLNGRA